MALEQITLSEVKAALLVRAAEKTGPAQFIRYTSAKQGSEFNPGARQRIIKMVKVQKDPMEPTRLDYIHNNSFFLYFSNSLNCSIDLKSTRRFLGVPLRPLPTLCILLLLN